MVNSSGKSLAHSVMSALRKVGGMAWDAYLRDSTTMDNLKYRVSHRNIDLMTGKQFEYFVANLLGEAGYRRVEVVGGANDRGADVICYGEDDKKLVVQCKRYKDTKVSSKEMQLFVGMALLEHHADLGVYVTSSLYTKSAAQIAHKHGIVAIDRLVLEKWCNGQAPTALVP